MNCEVTLTVTANYSDAEYYWYRFGPDDVEDEFIGSEPSVTFTATSDLNRYTYYCLVDSQGELVNTDYCIISVLSEEQAVESVTVSVGPNQYLELNPTWG